MQKTGHLRGHADQRFQEAQIKIVLGPFPTGRLLNDARIFTVFLHVLYTNC
jgi:hypothetical protein